MILGLMLAAASCTSAPTNEKEITQASNQPAEVEMAISQAVKPGIEVLRDNGFAQLKGKRVGLITNPTGVDNHLKSTIDILSEAPEVNLVALFAPEHGVRGDQVAGAMIANEVDKKTGIPVYSLHGKTKKPTPAMLKDIDILVYDIQDIGCRSYTFISTLGLAMEAAAENGKQFMVLDRPNPLGGNKVEGPIVEPGFTSFVSQYPVPYLYGLTPGEFAQFLNNEGKLKGGAKADLSVVAMKGWKRSMTFGDTGMPWVLPSPHIPYPYTALLYPSTGILGELNFVSIGVGAHHDVGDGGVLGLAGAVRHYGGIAVTVGQLDGVQGLGQGADLVDLDEDGVGNVVVKAHLEPLGVGDEQVVAHQLHPVA